MAQLTRHFGHLPILSNNHVLWSSHHWIYPYPSAVYSIPAACFSSHVSRLLGRTKGQCILIFAQIYRGLNIKFSIYRGSPISSQISRHFFTLGLTQLERGHKRPFETLDYSIGNPSHEIQKYVFSTYCWWSSHQPVFSWTTFAGFVFQGGHIFVHSFIGLFIISLSDSLNCTTLSLRGNCHVWVQYFTPSLTELCHLSTFAAFHTLNRFYDRHLVCSF